MCVIGLETDGIGSDILAHVVSIICLSGIRRDIHLYVAHPHSRSIYAMKTSSAKAKGRRLQQWVRDQVIGVFKELTIYDVKSTTMGESGLDVQLSGKARELFPYAVECKNCETTSPWKWYDQASYNCENLEPIVIFKKNGRDPVVLMDAKKFIELVGEKHE